MNAPTIKFPIFFLSWTGKASLEVDIPADTEERFRLKVAVEISVNAGANLAGANLAGANLAGANLAGANLARAYLAGAYLAGTDLAGANLAGAILAGANLAGANLAGANLAGGWKIKALLAVVGRVIEPYQFALWRGQDDSAQVSAGCHGPWTIARYREHVAQTYAGTSKAAETLRILDFFEATAAATVEKEA